MREPTEIEKYEFAGRVVDAAIIQASECSGLRKWLVKEVVHRFVDWHRPNADEALLEDLGADLMDQFKTLISDTEDDDGDPVSMSTVIYEGPEMPWQERGQ